MKTKISLLIGAALIPFLADCASHPVAIAPVGPAAIGGKYVGGSGYLRVYSATQTHVIAENTYYYPHTSYTIYDNSGAVVKFIRNHTGSMDETPARVLVPAGRYHIVAQSDSYGRVTVPVVIEDGKTTVVHLDRNWRPGTRSTANAIAKNLVRLPDGEAIGWKVD